jgi:hypothetical protein
MRVRIQTYQKETGRVDDFGPGVFHHKPYSFNAVPNLWVMKSTLTPILIMTRTNLRKRY